MGVFVQPKKKQACSTTLARPICCYHILSYIFLRIQHAYMCIFVHTQIERERQINLSLSYSCVMCCLLYTLLLMALDCCWIGIGLLLYCYCIATGLLLVAYGITYFVAYGKKQASSREEDSVLFVAAFELQR